MSRRSRRSGVRSSGRRSRKPSEVSARHDFIGLLPKEADWHYAGKRVSLGAADTPIFWYRPKDAKKYRVVYADLTVRESETPPSVPYVLPVVRSARRSGVERDRNHR